jgi:putative membrane protein
MNMKKLTALLVAPLLTLSLSMVCSAEMNTQTQTTTTDQQMSAPSQQSGKVTTWLIILDQNEIDAAKLALSRSKNPDVKKYAQMMIKDHTKNIKDTQALMKKTKQKMTVTPEVKSLKEMGKNEATKLKPLKEKEFDVAYITAMIDGHTAALQVLDQDIAQLPDNSPVKAHLQATREAVNTHLEKAKEINNTLG